LSTVHCRYCQQGFQRSLYHPNQNVCCLEACQRQRCRDYQRQKRQTDADYRETCRESQKKWRAAHPGYQKAYWHNHEHAAEQNRQRQRERDRQRRVQNLVKNNLALDLKRSTTGVWLVGPGVSDLVKNNLAASHIVIFQGDPGQQPAAPPS